MDCRKWRRPDFGFVRPDWSRDSRLVILTLKGLYCYENAVLEIVLQIADIVYQHGLTFYGHGHLRKWSRKTWIRWRSSDETTPGLVLPMREWLEKGVIWSGESGNPMFIPELVSFSGDGKFMTITDPDGKTAKFKRFDGTRNKELINTEQDLIFQGNHRFHEV